MAAEHPTVRARGRLEHRSPGRVRVRVDREHRTPQRMELVRDRLSGNAMVTGVEVNPKTGSVLLHGPRDDVPIDLLSDIFELITTTAAAPIVEPGVEEAVNLVKLVDDRIRDVTAGRLSLRLLVPATFIGVGIRQLLAEGLSLSTVPWYVLIYYGVDSFLKLYPEHAPQAREATAS
jgi:hypothetical protein